MQRGGSLTSISLHFKPVGLAKKGGNISDPTIIPSNFEVFIQQRMAHFKIVVREIARFDLKRVPGAMLFHHPGVRTFLSAASRVVPSRVALSHKNHVNLLVSDAQILQTHGSESPGPSERKKFRVTRGCCCKNFATH